MCEGLGDNPELTVSVAVATLTVVAVAPGIAQAGLLGLARELGDSAFDAAFERVTGLPAPPSSITDLGESFLKKARGNLAREAKKDLRKVGGATAKDASEKAQQQATRHSGVTWVDENSAMPKKARDYQDSAPGARSNVATRKPQAPQIEGADGPVRFDGQEGDVLVDRKSGVATTKKSVRQAKRQSDALKENGMTGRWEVPNARSEQRAQRVIEKAKADNVKVKKVE